MNIEKKSKLWLKAKAHTELDGFLLPAVFTDKVQEFLRDDITFAQLVDFYESLLPDEKTLKTLYQQFESEYMEFDVSDEHALEALCERPLRKDETVYNGFTLKNMMGMQMALSTYRSLLQDV